MSRPTMPDRPNAGWALAGATWHTVARLAVICGEVTITNSTFNSVVENPYAYTRTRVMVSGGRIMEAMDSSDGTMARFVADGEVAA